MGLAKAKQLALAIESVPGTAATLSGSDVIDALEVDFEFTQDFLERQPAGGSLSKGVQPPGQSSGRITARLDAKGSGSVGTAPKVGRFLEAGLYERITLVTLNLGSLNDDLVPGDKLTGQTSSAVGLVCAYVAKSVGAVSIPLLVVSGTFGGTEAIDSALKGTSVGTTTASPTTASQGFAYKPLTSSQMTVELAAAWTAADPGSGQGIVVKDGDTVKGEAFFISQSGTTLTMEWAWGEIAAGYSLSSKSAAGAAVTASVHGTTPALTQTKGKTATAQYIRHRLRRLLTGCRASFSIEADAGAAGVVAVTLQGSVQTSADSAQLTASGAETTSPPRFIGPNGKRGSAHINGVPVPTQKVSVDAANEVARRQDANASQGDAGGAVTGRAPTASIQLDQVSVQTLDIQSLIQAGTTVRFGAQLGNTAGNRIAVFAPAAQLTAMTDDDADGNATHTVTVQPRAESIAGDDELYIAFS